MDVKLFILVSNSFNYLNIHLTGKKELIHGFDDLQEFGTTTCRSYILLKINIFFTWQFYYNDHDFILIF